MKQKPFFATLREKVVVIEGDNQEDTQIGPLENRRPPFKFIDCPGITQQQGIPESRIAVAEVRYLHDELQVGITGIEEGNLGLPTANIFGQLCRNITICGHQFTVNPESKRTALPVQ